MADLAKMQEIVEAIDTAVLNIVSSGGIASYSIAGRSITKYNMGEWMMLRDKYKAEIDSAMYGSGITYAHLGN